MKPFLPIENFPGHVDPTFICTVLCATELNEATFKDAMNSGKNVFVKFLAPW